MTSYEIPFLMMELANGGPIFNEPLAFTERIRYESFNVSENLIVFGASSGSLYLFKKHPRSFMELIPKMDGSVEKVLISPSEKYIAYLTNKNQVCILELDEDERGTLVSKSGDVKDPKVTTLHWINEVTLLTGNMAGEISALKLTYLSKRLSLLPIMMLDEEIVQINSYSYYVVVSTIRASYLLYDNKETLKKIGTQLRRSHQGACFVHSRDEMKLYCARPKCRLWEVNLNGEILLTKMYQKRLNNAPSLFVSIFANPVLKYSIPLNASHQFNRIYKFAENFIFNFHERQVSVLDTEEAVLFGTEFKENIIDAQCAGNTFYVWLANGEMREYIFLPLDQCVLQLYVQNYYELCAEVISFHMDWFLTTNVSFEHLSPLSQTAFERYLIDRNKCDRKMMKFFDRLKTKLKEEESNANEKSKIVKIINKRDAMDVSKKVLAKYSATKRLTAHKSLEDLHFRLILDTEVKPRKWNSLPNLNDKMKLVTVDFRKMEVLEADNAGNVANNELTPYYAMAGPSSQIRLMYAPYVPLASCELLHDGLMDLGANLTEKFIEGSKTLKSMLPFSITYDNSPLNVRENENNRDEKGNGFANTNGHISEEEDTDDEPLVSGSEKLREKSSFSSHSEEIMKNCDKVDFSDTQSLILFLEYIFDLWSCMEIIEPFPFEIYIPPDYHSKIFRIFERVSKFHLILDFKDVTSHLESCGLAGYPKVFDIIYDEKSLNEDRKLCLTVFIFWKILDFSTILGLLRSLKMNCYYMTLRAVLDLTMKNRGSSISKHLEDTPSRLVGSTSSGEFIGIMYLKLLNDDIRGFVNMAKKWDVPWIEIVYMIYGRELNCSSNGDEKNKNLLIAVLNECGYQVRAEQHFYYVAFLVDELFNKVLSPTDSAQRCSRCLFPTCIVKTSDSNHSRVEECLLRILLEQISSHFGNATDKVNEKFVFTEAQCILLENLIGSSLAENCTLCYPTDLACVHTLCQNIKNRVNYPTSEIDRIYLCKMVNLILKICFVAPYLYEHLACLQDEFDFKILTIELAIQLGFVPFSTSHENISLELAKEIVRWNVVAKEGKCANCGSLNAVGFGGCEWDYLAMQFLHRNLKSEDVINLLSSVPDFSASKKFYRSCILLAMVEKDNGGSGDFNRSKLMNAMRNFDNVQSSTSRKALNAGSTDDAGQVRWGTLIHTDDNSCMCCGLPLGNKALLQNSNGEIVAFQCGHDYHSVCLTHKQSLSHCMYCARKKIPK